jgi:hypothetical protein
VPIRDAQNGHPDANDLAYFPTSAPNVGPSVPEIAPTHPLWVEGYARSLIDPSGPWADFARQTVTDWLDVLARCQPASTRATAAAAAQRTAALALLRGTLLDLLATGDQQRTTAAHVKNSPHCHEQLASPGS